MMNKLIVCVAVENTVYHFDKLFDYAVKDNLTEEIKTGKRVLIPFGKGNTKRVGMIMDIKEGENESLKSVISVLDKSTVLNDEMIKLVSFIKEQYFCTYFDAIKAMLPIGITLKIGVEYQLCSDIDESDLSEEYISVVTFIKSKKGKVKSEQLYKQFPFFDDSLYQEMVDKRILIKKDSAFQKIGDKSTKMVRVSDNAMEIIDSITLTQKQNMVMDTLFTVGSVSVKELIYYTGVTSSVIDNLFKKDLITYYDDEVFRIPKTNHIKKKEYLLSDEQKSAFDNLYSLYKEEKSETALLYGVTGSGKTSVYFKLIEEVIKDDKSVIVMVPEIALTPQLVSLFKSYFSDNVAIFHSALSIGERFDEYKRVKKGLAKIVIGTRSAVFAPCVNLGLIIMDEEQEHTYKSEGKPRFHARTLSKFRIKYNNALLLLSSATPSIETNFYAESGIYKKFTLKNRYGNAVLPEVITVDMNEEIKNKNTSEFSSVLLEEIEKNLQNNKQSILLLNRRGHNNFVSCRSCKTVITCPNCSITLKYHSANKKLMCHYCGYSQNVPDVCPECGSEKLRFFGFGTQRAESDIGDIFEDARVLRMDTDATMSKSSYEEKLSAFGNKEYDILVGTQMVAKGLDFPDVTLVGILNADQMLYSDDYRSYENTFSLLTQVIGRAGRGDYKGKAIIQTFTPSNNIISLSAMQDYDAFYSDEIEVRKALLYPPFASIVLVGFVSENKTLAEMASKKFTELLVDKLDKSDDKIPIRLLGPSAQTVVKVSNKYRYKLIIKCKNDKKFRSTLSDVLIEFSKEKKYLRVTTYVDVSPLQM